MEKADLSLTLYHAGRSVNSARALDQLQRLLAEHGVDATLVEYVDVFEQPRRALDDRVMLTPALRIEFDGKVTWSFGDLSDDQTLVEVLRRNRAVTG